MTDFVLGLAAGTMISLASHSWGQKDDRSSTECVLMVCESHPFHNWIIQRIYLVFTCSSLDLSLVILSYIRARSFAGATELNHLAALLWPSHASLNQSVCSNPARKPARTGACYASPWKKEGNYFLIINIWKYFLIFKIYF